MKWMSALLFTLPFFSFADSQSFDNQVIETCYSFCDPVENITYVEVDTNGCSVRTTPCSTFKLPLAVMGYDTGVLIDEHTPTWVYEEGDEPPHCLVEPPLGPLSPENWIRCSCVWYSQILARRLGMNRIKNYLKLFKYGNEDMSGGLTCSWLCSSLQISVREQVRFLNRLVTTRFDMPQEAFEKLKHIFFVEHLPNGWDVYGKTGSGKALLADGTYSPDRKQGWFVGWIEKDGICMTFAIRRVYADPDLWAAGVLTREWFLPWLRGWAQNPSPAPQSIQMSKRAGS